jgi:hypothetical protein
MFFRRGGMKKAPAKSEGLELMAGFEPATY